MHSNQASKPRIAGYDLIRVLACFFVIVVHFNAALCNYQNGIFLYSNEIFPNFYFREKIYLGTLGVVLFFILSGASLTLSTKQNTGAFCFYSKRILSVYPAFWIAFLTATFVDFLYNKGMAVANPWGLLSSITCMDGYFHQLGLISSEYYKLGEWFLGCIILLYLLFPIIYAALNRAPILTSVVCACIYGVGLLAIRYQLPYFYNTSLLICLPEMVLGMLYVKYDLSSRPRTSLSIGIAAFLLLCLFADRLMSDIATLLAAVFLFCTLIAVSQWLQSQKIKDWLQRLAELTYPLFLIHHWLIYKLIIGFDLTAMPRMYIFLLFVIYILLGLLLSVGLKKASSIVGRFLGDSRLLMSTAMIVLVIGYACTVGMAIQQFRTKDIPATIITESEQYCAEIVSATIQTDTIYVVVKNTGDTEWSEEEKFRCGLLLDGVDSGVRGCLDSEQTVFNGQYATFTLPLTSDYDKNKMSVVMLKEGTAYFGNILEIN